MSEKEKQKLDDVETEKVSGGTKVDINIAKPTGFHCPNCGKEVSELRPHKIPAPVNMNLQHLYAHWCDDCLKSLYVLSESNSKYNPK